MGSPGRLQRVKAGDTVWTQGTPNFEDLAGLKTWSDHSVMMIIPAQSEQFDHSQRDADDHHVTSMLW